MIFRDERGLQSYMDIDLDKVDQLRQTRMEQFPEYYKQFQPQNIKNLQYKTPNSAYQEEFNQEHQGEIPKQDESEPILQKFKIIMENAKKDMDLVSVKSSKSNFSQKSQLKNQQNDNSDTQSMMSIAESKFGDILLNNPNLSVERIQQLIKDNFPYFKHIFGYCACFVCPCGFCKCDYIKMGTQKIKFRGNFINLSTKNSDQGSINDLKNNYNQNLLNIPSQKQFIDREFLTDKVTGTQNPGYNIPNLEKNLNKKLNAPFSELTTNKLNNIQNIKLQKLQPMKNQGQYPQPNTFQQQNKTAYSDQFLGQKGQADQLIKKQDAKLFFKLPQFQSSYQTSYIKPEFRESMRHRRNNKQVFILIRILP